MKHARPGEHTSVVPVRPTFLVVGAAKTGTSWLHLCFREHPEVFVTDKGEIDFFSWHFDKGADWYASFFQEYDGEKAIGEVSPSYMITPEVPERLHAWNPDLKLIFIFRDPVARAYSHYCMVLRGGFVSDEVDRELVPDTRYVDEGLYAYHLDRFLQYFPANQIKCLVYEDLKRDPKAFLAEVLTFLEVDPAFEPSILEQPFHVRKPRPRYQGLYNRLVRLSMWIGDHSKASLHAIRFLRKRGYVDVFHRMNRGPSFPELTVHKKRELAEFYRDDSRALSERMGRDLVKEWLQRYL